MRREEGKDAKTTRRRKDSEYGRARLPPSRDLRAGIGFQGNSSREGHRLDPPLAASRMKGRPLEGIPTEDVPSFAKPQAAIPVSTAVPLHHQQLQVAKTLGRSLALPDAHFPVFSFAFSSRSSRLRGGIFYRSNVKSIFAGTPSRTSNCFSRTPSNSCHALMR